MALSSDELAQKEAMLSSAAATGTAGTKGAWVLPAATVGGQLIPAIAAAIPGKYLRGLRKQQRAEKRALRKAGKITPKQRAEARSIQERYEQQARMVAGRGSAVGGASGMDREAARDIRNQGRAASSEYLKGAREENLSKMQALAKQVRATGAQIGKINQARMQQAVGSISKAATSPATSKAMKQFGDLQRQKAAEKRGAGLLTAQKLSAKARQANRAATSADQITLGKQNPGAISLTEA